FDGNGLAVVMNDIDVDSGWAALRDGPIADSAFACRQLNQCAAVAGGRYVGSALTKFPEEAFCFDVPSGNFTNFLAGMSAPSPDPARLAARHQDFFQRSGDGPPSASRALLVLRRLLLEEGLFAADDGVGDDEFLFLFDFGEFEHDVGH